MRSTLILVSFGLLVFLATVGPVLQRIAIQLQSTVQSTVRP